MKTIKNLWVIGLLTLCQAHAQDVIVKQNGQQITSRVVNADLNSLFYKTADNPDGPELSIAKSDVAEVRFSNGKTEYFGNRPAINTTSIEETQRFIVDEINKHAYDPDSFKRRFQAAFEGDYLRLTLLNKKGEPTSHSLLYDFSNVYRFSGVDRRSDQLAYINIYVSFLENKKRNKWDKIKIVMRVDSDTRAESIFNALKHYNALMLKKEKGDSKF